MFSSLHITSAQRVFLERMYDKNKENSESVPGPRPGLRKFTASNLRPGKTVTARKATAMAKLTIIADANKMKVDRPRLSQNEENELEKNVKNKNKRKNKKTNGHPCLATPCKEILPGYVSCTLASQLTPKYHQTHSTHQNSCYGKFLLF